MARPKYGRAHQRATKAAVRTVQWGTTPCCRCEHPLELGDRVELDHNDDGVGYKGLSHSSPCKTCGERCNQKAGGEKAALQAGKQLRDRICVIDGTPFTATSGSVGALQVTCGRQECKTALRRLRKAYQPDPTPPETTGREW